MKFSVENFTKEVPFKIAIMNGPLSGKDKKHPHFFWSIAHSYNQKSKAAYKCLAFTHQFSAEEVVCRLLHCVVAAWPESKDNFRRLLVDFLNEPKSSEGHCTITESK